MDSSIIPTVPPPPGQTSNFTNPESRAWQLYTTITVLTVFVVGITLLRIYTRLRFTGSFGIDDFLWKPGGGILGIHLWDVPLDSYVKNQKASLINSIILSITNTTIKVAFLVFYFRLFKPITYVRYMVWIGITVLVTFCVVLVTIDAIACSPLPNEHGSWTAPSFIARCDDLAANLFLTAAYVNVISDIYILFIPIRQVRRLNLSKKQKIGLTFVFLTGLLATVAGLINLLARMNPAMYTDDDFTWTLIPIYATSIVEINVGLLCHSMPAVSAVFMNGYTDLSRTLSSWVRGRRSPRQSSDRSAGESSLNLALSNIPAPRTSPLADKPPSFSGIRK
ncbi:hypothetical protein F5Y10DRAFT_267360 [Nemania abortiva]|nr:hypothetical protein F5Y10DRAFT_267360 [Nemania abortiva]